MNSSRFFFFPQKPSKSKFQLPRGKKPDEKVKMNKGIIDYEL